jgi:dTDP-4-dehydrorhamnose reductase
LKKKAKVLIFGAYGFLGTRLKEFIQKKDVQIFCQGRGANSDIAIDPVDESAVSELTKKINPDLVLNLVANTNVDQCEENYGDAFDANVVVVQNIAKAIRGKKSRLIHISTDHLYGGEGPHIENRIELVNKYAITKRIGEFAASQISSTILRTNFIGKSKTVGRISFTDWLYDGLNTNKALFLFSDVLFSPLYIEDLCSAVWIVMNNPSPGIFNLGSRGGISKADFGIAFAKRLGFDTGNLELREICKAKLLAKRPKDMRMNSTKFENTFGHILPTIWQTIEKCCQEYANG